MTHWGDCALNISHDDISFPSCVPPKANIDDAEDVTAGEMRGSCSDAAAAASPVSKLTTSTSVQPRPTHPFHQKIM